MGIVVCPLCEWAIELAWAVCPNCCAELELKDTIGSLEKYSCPVCGVLVYVMGKEVGSGLDNYPKRGV